MKGKNATVCKLMASTEYKPFQDLSRLPASATNLMPHNNRMITCMIYSQGNISGTRMINANDNLMRLVVTAQIRAAGKE